MSFATLGRFLSKLVLFALLLSTFGCDESSVRTLGATVGLRGQDAGNAAVLALEKISDYEQVDYSQRQMVQILVQPKQVLDLPPSQLNPLLAVPRYQLDAKQIQNRIELYRQLTKAYAALQKLSDGNFGKDSQEAATAFNASLSKIRAVPQLPAGVSSLLSGVTGFVVDKKQADDIRKINLNLYRLVRAHRELWKADRPVWTAYLQRVKGAYVNNLKSVPADRFDEDQLRQYVKKPFAKTWLVQIYKNDEEARVSGETAKMENYFARVDAAFAQLEKGHVELSKQMPSYLDAIAEVDAVVSIVEPVLKNK